MTQNTGGFRFATFNPIQNTQSRRNPEGSGIRFSEINAPLLAQQLNLLQEHKLKAEEKRTALDAALGDIESKLNESEIPWFNEYKDNIRNQIQSEIDAGNYNSAMRVATNLAGQTARDTNILDRVKYNEDRNKLWNEVKSNNKYDSLTKQRWDALNSYNFDEIGNRTFKETFKPVEDISIPQMQAVAAQIQAERANGSSSQNTSQVLLDKDGKETTNFSNAVSVKSTTTHGGGTTTHAKDRKDLEDVWNLMVKQDPNLAIALKQKYDNYVWAIKDSRQKENDLSLSEDERAKAKADADWYEEQLKDDNGIIYGDVSEWSKQAVLPQFRHFAYNNTTSNSVNSTTYDTSAFTQKSKQAIGEQYARMYGITENVGVLGTPILETIADFVTSHSSDEYDAFFANLKK